MKENKEKLTNWLNKKSLKELQEIGTACDLSVKKWDKIIAGTGEDHLSRNCPLCILRENIMNSCDECVITMASGGMRHCTGIGWGRWNNTAISKISFEKGGIRYLVIGKNNPEAEKCAVEVRDNLIKISGFVKKAKEKKEGLKK